VISTQHADSVNQGAIKEFVMEELIKKHIPALISIQKQNITSPDRSNLYGGPWVTLV